MANSVLDSSNILILCEVGVEVVLRVVAGSNAVGRY